MWFIGRWMEHMKALRINGWNRYEKADSKKCTTMQWVAVPINHDGLGYIEMITRPDGLRTVGGWLLILQLAAKCPTRGLLVTDSGRALGAREIALKTRASESDIQAAISVLLEHGWIEEVEVSGSLPEPVRTPSGLQDKTRQDRTRQTKQVADAPGISSSPINGEVKTPNANDQARELRSKYPCLKFISVEAISQTIVRYGFQAIADRIAKAQAFDVELDRKGFDELHEGRKSDFGGYDTWRPLKPVA